MAGFVVNLLLLLVVATSSAQSRKSTSKSTYRMDGWMAAKRDLLWDRPLSTLTIPGTHDSASFNLTSTMLPGSEPSALADIIKIAERFGIPAAKVVRMWSETQPSTSLVEQLDAGARYIDLRCGWEESKLQWVAFHGLVGLPVEELLPPIAAWAKAHPGEVLVIETGHYVGHPGPNNTQIQWLVNNISKAFDGMMFPAPSKFPDVQRTQSSRSGNCTTHRVFPTFGEMISSGNRVLISLSDDVLAKHAVNHSLWPGNYTFNNSYADTPSLVGMMAFNAQKLREFHALQRSTCQGASMKSLFKISWTLTPKATTIIDGLLHLPNATTTIRELATTANKQMIHWLRDAAENAPLRHFACGNVLEFDNYATFPLREVIDLLYS